MRLEGPKAQDLQGLGKEDYLVGVYYFDGIMRGLTS